MSFKTFSLLSVVCVSLALVGCESQRYKPADWRSADNSTLTDRGAVSAVTDSGKAKKKLERPESPTNWMELSGTGGEAVGERSASDNVLRSQSGTTSLPQRSGTSMPSRSGTSLPSRGNGLGTSLPNRQNRYNTGVGGTTTPQRGRYQPRSTQPGSTLPARNSGSTLPRR